MTDRILSLGDWYDLAKAKANEGASVDEIVQATGISRAQATLFWCRAHPGSLEHSDGLRRTERENAPWYQNCVKELTRKAEDE